MMKNILNCFYSFCLWFTLGFSVLILGMSFVVMNHGKDIFFGTYGKIFQILVAFSAGFLALLLLLKVSLYNKKTGSKNNRVLWCGLGLIVLFQIIYYCFVSRTAPTTDAARIMDEALAMLRHQNGQLNMKLEYFQHYHNNHYVVLFLYFFYWLLSMVGVQNFWIPTIILNVICIDLGIFISYFSMRKIKGIQAANLFLILCILCPTTYVWITFAYTNTFSIPFVMACLYLYLLIRERNIDVKCIWLCALLGICIVIGCMVRLTTFIPLIAIVICDVVRKFVRKENLEKQKKEKWIQTAKKAGMLCGAILVIFVGLNSIKTRHVENVYQEEQFPITHWLMMGTKEYGQYNEKDVTYTKKFPTRQEKKQANMEMIKKRLRSAGVTGTIKLVVKKIALVWAIGADDALDKGKSAYEYPVLYPYFMGNQNQWFVVYLQVFRIVTFFFLAVSVWGQLRKKQFEDIFLYTLTLLGAFFFFILWEANCKYNICFIYVCLMLMADGVEKLESYVCDWQEKCKTMKFGLRFGMVLLTGLLIVLWNVVPMKSSSDVVYAYYVEGNNAVSVQEIKKNVRLLEQTIERKSAGYGQEWNQIKVFFKFGKDKGTSDDQYTVSCTSEKSQKVLYTEKIGRKDIGKDGSYCIQLPNAQISGKEEKYRLRIECVSKYIDMFPAIVNMSELDTYPYGELSLDGNVGKYDLYFQLLHAADKKGKEKK